MMTGLAQCCHLQKWKRGCLKQIVQSCSVLAPHMLHREPINRSYSCYKSQAKTVNTNCLLQKQCSRHQPFQIQQCTYATDILYSMSKAGFVCFNSIHSLTDTPWWLSIVLVVVPMRVGLQVLKEYYLRKNTNRLVGVQEEMKTKVVPHVMKMTHHIGSDLPESVRTNLKEDLKKLREKDFKTKVKQAQKILYRKRKCHPLKPVAYGVLHIPVWISLSLSLREMAGRNFFFCKPRADVYTASLSTEGLWWFPDLAVPDPLLILPVITVLSFWTSMEISKLREMSLNLDGSKQPIFLKIVDYVSKFGLVILLLFSAYFPSAMTFYWSVSSLSANIVTLVLLSPKVRHTLNFEPLSMDSNTPYKDLINSMKIRYNPNTWYTSILSKMSRSKDSQGENEDNTK